MKRSPTDTIVAAMDQAETAEECIVILTSNTGDILWLCSSDQFTVKLGLIETAKQCIVADVRASRDGGRG